MCPVPEPRPRRRSARCDLPGARRLRRRSTQPPKRTALHSLADEQARPLLHASLQPPAEGLLAAYYDKAGPFAGDTFDRFGLNDPDKVGADDLLAVSMLDVPIKPLALRRLLGDRADQVTEAMAALPRSLDLWDAGNAVLDAVDIADDLLRTFDGMGPVVASKLLSRKRPRLVPVVDSVVLRLLDQPPDAYKSARRQLSRWLQDPDLLTRLHELTGPLPDGVSALRALDVVLWMRGSGSRNARKARERQGLPA